MVYLFVELVLLRFRIEVLFRVLESLAKADELPVEDEIDVLREALDQTMCLRERCPALEDKGFCEPRFLEQEFQDEADPEVPSR